MYGLQIFQNFCKKGFAIVHPPKREYMGGLTLPGGIAPEEWDTFHSIILNDELYRYVGCSRLLISKFILKHRSRVGYSGALWGLNGGNNIGAPPIMNFGNEKQKQLYLPKIARGEIRFCLGITEPDGMYSNSRVLDNKIFLAMCSILY